MKNFEDVEELVGYMFEMLDENNPVSVVANKELAIMTMKELLDYENVILKIADIDDYDYDKEYLVSLYDSDENWYVNIEKLYNTKTNSYFGINGYVLYHEEVNSKALVEMQNNKNCVMSGHDWFSVGDDETFDEDEESEDENIPAVSSNIETVYKVNGKEVDKKTFDAAMEDIEDTYLDNVRDMLLRYCDVMDSVNEWRKFFW